MASNKSKGTAGLVCGICSVVFCWCWWLGIPLGVVAIVMSALQNKDYGDGGTAGLALGIIGTALSIIILIVISLIAASVMSAVGSLASYS